MRIAILNSILLCAMFCFSCSLRAVASTSADWRDPAQQLARKIVAVTGPGAVGITIENRSSMTKKDFDTISNLLKVELKSMGARAATADQAAALATISLSENPLSYVWVAQVTQGSAPSSVVMVSVPRRKKAGFGQESMPLTLRKIPLWTQEERILDVAVLEEDSEARCIAVLDREKVTIYRLRSGKWLLDQQLVVNHARPWPRDLRGRLLAAKDHLIDVYLPGVFCRSTSSVPLALNCRESDDPWPLMSQVSGSFTSVGGAYSVPLQGGFYSASRNFFTGALTPGIGKLTTVGKFYSAAALPREKYTLWVFAAVDGQIHFVDGVTDQTAKLGWGSDIVSVKTACGSGWQVLTTGAADNRTDTVQAYEIADRDPVAVSTALEFSGEVTALWSEAKGDSAIAILRNREAGEYEAFRLAVSCGQ